MSLESHNQWGRPGGPQGAALGGGGEEAEGEGNSLINQTVAMAIAGTSTASPMSRPSSFLLNSQVGPCLKVLPLSVIGEVLQHIFFFSLCPFEFFPPMLIPAGPLFPGGSPAWQLLGRVQPQPSYLSAVGAKECRRAGVTEVV